jgi:hypothetical protein
MIAAVSIAVEIRCYSEDSSHFCCKWRLISNQHVLKMTPFPVSWTPCTPFYVFIRFTGESKSHPSRAEWHSHPNRYLILNFGNVANLDLDMWCVGYVLAEYTFDSYYRASNVRCPPHTLLAKTHRPSLTLHRFKSTSMYVRCLIQRIVLMTKIGSHRVFGTTVGSLSLSLARKFS